MQRFIEPSIGVVRLDLSAAVIRCCGEVEFVIIK